MKNAIILHGSGGTPDDFWFPWLKVELEKKGYKVWVPQLPDTANPDLKTWLPYVLNNGHFDEETILVGHSAGCPLILSILEHIDIKIKKAVLAAGFITSLLDAPMPILQEKYDWEKIRAHCEEFVFVNSDNDPWKCDDKQGREMQKNLGGRLVILHDGHFGSGRYGQEYDKFPKILELVVQ